MIRHWNFRSIRNLSSVPRFHSAKEIVDRLISQHKSAFDLMDINPHQELRWMIETLVGAPKQTVKSLTHSQVELLESWVHQRVHLRKPLQYILETWPFSSLRLRVRPPVLIPRPETEEWCEWLIKEINSFKHQHSFQILDICTGSGNLALALASQIKNSSVIGLDVSDHALELANFNKEQLKLPNVKFIKWDVLSSPTDFYSKVKSKRLTQRHLQKDEPLSHQHNGLMNFGSTINQKFDLIVSNPPYLDQASWETLQEEIRYWEDPAALLADHNGLHFYEQIVQAAPYLLRSYPPNVSSSIPRPLPQLVLEIGDDQGESVCKLLTKRGFIPKIHLDFCKRQRWISANTERALI